VIVLQQVDNRYFNEISGSVEYDFEFVVFKKGSKEEYASSTRIMHGSRSRNVEVHLEAGDYVAHVSRIDQSSLLISELIAAPRFAWILMRSGHQYARLLLDLQYTDPELELHGGWPPRLG
jgi:hypothetical protein